jgi:hypothetical protein
MNISRKGLYRVSRVLPALMLCLGNVVLPAAEKMTAEKVRELHLASLGSEKARSSAVTRHLIGKSLYMPRLGGVGQQAGHAEVLCSGQKLMLCWILGLLEYPAEKVAYDGRDVTNSVIRSGVRSVLGQFLWTHPWLVSKGLLGGTLTSAWPLLQPPAKNYQLKYSGEKKIDGRPVHELRFQPAKGGGDITVSLSFDSETGHHLRTEYRLYVTAMMGDSPDTSSQQMDSRFLLLESFADFRQEQGLAIPHSYKLVLSVERPERTTIQEWEMQLTGFEMPATIAADVFDAYK